MNHDPTATPEIVKIADGMYARVAVDNIAWMTLGEELLVVDALEQPDLKGEIFREIETTMGNATVRYVLNTHTHGDHTALNSAFEREHGAEIVNVRTRQIGEDGLWFEGPQRRAWMFPTPGCHTSEDCCVWVPEDKVLFVGDIFGWGLIAPNGPLDAATADRLVRTHERFLELGPETVVPGHGPLCTGRELERWLEYFRWLDATVREAVAAGQRDRDIIETITPPEDMRDWWRFVDWKHENSIEKVLHAVRAGWGGLSEN